MHILDHLTSPEGKTLEFKRDLSSPEGILRVLIAFANTAGGTLLIGVEDGTRHVRGIEYPLEAEERLANLIADNIQPRLLPEVEIVPWRQTQVLSVRVYPSASRPHYLKREGEQTGVYVRLGSTNRRADRELIEEMRRITRGVSFDEQPMPELNSEAIDFRAASEQFAQFRKLKRADLDTLRLVTTYQGRKVPTVGGLLLYGREREAHFPDAWIQVGRFDGTDRSRILDRATLRDHPASNIGQAIAFVQKHMHFGAEIGPAQRTDRWTLPPVAVREAIINAVVHADYSQTGAPIRLSLYSDRLEVENPGILPFGLTVADVRQGISRLRNRVLGRVFHELRLVEQWGSGIQRMTAACLDAGHPAPDLEEIGMRFRVTLYITRQAATARDEIDRKILSLLAGREGCLTSEVAAAIQLTPRATRTRLARLTGHGLVAEIGSGSKDPRRRYFLVRTGNERLR